MSRWLAAIAIVAMSAGAARADGFVKLGFQIASKPRPVDSEPAEAAPAETSTPAPNVPVDLFPRRAIAGPSRPDLVYRPKTDVEAPPSQGISLGDDRDWKVQAAQVGVMAGAFAALVALCGNGKCMW